MAQPLKSNITNLCLLKKTFMHTDNPVITRSAKNPTRLLDRMIDGPNAVLILSQGEGGCPLFGWSHEHNSIEDSFWLPEGSTEEHAVKFASGYLTAMSVNRIKR
jgi:hypothetical protein